MKYAKLCYEPHIDDLSLSLRLEMNMYMCVVLCIIVQVVLSGYLELRGNIYGTTYERPEIYIYIERENPCH